MLQVKSAAYGQKCELEIHPLLTGVQNQAHSHAIPTLSEETGREMSALLALNLMHTRKMLLFRMHNSKSKVWWWKDLGLFVRVWAQSPRSSEG